MKTKTAKQKINALVKQLQDENHTQIGIVILNDLLLRSARMQRDEIIDNRDLYENHFIGPQVFIDVYDIIIKHLGNE